MESIKPRNNLKNRIRRVDVQVSILTVCIVTIVCACVFSVYYSVTYRDMISSLNDRVYSIYHHLENVLDKESFVTIKTKQDQSKQCYQAMKSTLENVKEATGVRYLYTATRTPQGDFIYVVDGLSEQAEDFRYPGDLIEAEISSEMERAMAGEIVLPGKIKDTDWGKIFITYFPIHDGDKVIGVLGIEFEAEHQFNTYHTLKLLTPGVILLSCLLCAVLSVLLFRRISNPTYQDLSNTDQLTGLKNRNAFDWDLKNRMASRTKWKLGIVVVDLNNLKKVNDEGGHEMGDDYIKSAANALRAAAGAKTILYRTGGDEFAALLPDADETAIEAFLHQVRTQFYFPQAGDTIDTSLAMGYSIYDKSKDADLYTAYRQADLAMYQDKRAFHSRTPEAN